MSGGFDVEPAALTKASSEIIECVKPAGNMDVEGISGNSEWYGHEGVYEAIARFCPTWQIAVTLLMQRSVTAGQTLHGAAQRYVQTDDSGGQAMGQIQSTLTPQ